MHGYFRSIIDQHRETFNPQETRDLVDAYLLEFLMAKEEGREDELFFGKDPGEQSSKALVLNIFVPSIHSLIT
jgi:non-homologous end joining protein Ku